MSDRNVKIIGFKLLKGKADSPGKTEIKFRETFTDKSHVISNNEFDGPAHKDLINALNGFKPHLALLTEFLQEKQLKDESLLEKFHVSGYSIGGKEEEEGITIKGYRTGKRGNTTLNTPFTRFDSEDDKAYILIADLQEKLASLEFEVLKYLIEGKRAPDPQGSLFDEEGEPVTKMQIAEPLQTSVGTRLPPADPEAMARVAAGDEEDKPKGKRASKKVAQSAAVPSGEVSE